MRDLLEFIAKPSNLFVTFIVIGFVLLMLRRLRRLAMSCLALGTAALLTFGYSSAGELLMAPLVSRFPPLKIEEIPEPFGIIVLGGGLNETYAKRTGVPVELGEDGDIVVITAILAKRFPQARIIVSAGSGGPWPAAPLREADGVGRFLTESGISTTRLFIDGLSGSTFERVRNSINLMGEDRDQTWLVIGSAHKMPRVMGTFRTFKMEPLPYPVDFRWIAPFDPFYTYTFASGLRMTDLAAKEWLGLLMYRYQGKITRFFPGP